VADTSPTSLIVIMWMKLCTDHYCPSNRTEHKGIRALNGKQLMRDWPSLVTSLNCRYRPADATSAKFLWRCGRIVWELREEPLCGRSPQTHGWTTVALAWLLLHCLTYSVAHGPFYVIFTQVCGPPRIF
jgi:hypothetical protein